MWEDEHKLYKYPDGFSMATGHYTQVRIFLETFFHLLPSKTVVSSVYVFQIEDLHVQLITIWIYCNINEIKKYLSYSMQELIHELVNHPLIFFQETWLMIHAIF